MTKYPRDEVVKLMDEQEYQQQDADDNNNKNNNKTTKIITTTTTQTTASMETVELNSLNLMAVSPVHKLLEISRKVAQNFLKSCSKSCHFPKSCPKVAHL